MAAHSEAGPSVMPRIVQCPGSVRLVRAVPRVGEEDPSAAEGTAAHEVLAWHLDTTLPAGPVASNGVPLDDEMREAAQMCADFARSLGVQLTVERTIRIPRIHAECFGTPDVWGWEEPRNGLHVIDFKYGHGFVGAERNYQLMTYAAGLITDEPDDCAVHLHIVQPRNYHRDGPIRTWHTTVGQLRPHWAAIKHAVTLALDPLCVAPPLRLGDECEHCPARHGCGLLQDASLDVADRVHGAIPLDLPVQAAARELAALIRAQGLLEARLTGLQAQVSDALRRGEPVRGWALEQGYGREAWTKPPEEVRALGAMMGVTVEKSGLLTPGQARKAGLPADVVALYAEKPRGAVKLVQDDGRKAAAVFGGAA